MNTIIYTLYWIEYMLAIDDKMYQKIFDKYYLKLENILNRPKKSTMNFTLTPQNIQLFAMTWNMLSIMSTGT